MTSQTDTAGVEVQGVTKRFDEVVAVDNVTLSIAPGEFVSLLGPSGCGKTTTLRMIAGFEFPDEGDILLGGSSIIGTPPHRRDSSMVFQDYALFPHRTVAQNIAFGLRMRKLPKDLIAAKVEETLSLVELEGLGSRKPDQLSGGQRQRVALGRALVVGPSVLLLDEPLGALDLQLRKQMQIELKRIHAELGITFIYVTHDQEEAITMSDRIAVMNAGRVEQFAPVAEIYSRPATPFVAEFIGEANLLPATIGSATETHITLDVSGGGISIVAEGVGSKYHQGESVIAVIRPEHVSMDTDVQSLENHFELMVSDVIFAGPFTRIIGTIGDREIRLTESGSKHVKPGDKIRVGWRASDVVTVPGE